MWLNQISAPKSEALFRALLRPILIASFLELILWRILSSSGPPPNLGTSSHLYSILLSLAPFVLNAAHVTTSLAAILAAFWLLRMPGIVSRVAALSLLILAQLGLLLPLLGYDGGIWLVYQGVFLGGLFALLWRFGLSRGTMGKIYAILLVGTYLSSFYYKAKPVLAAYENLPSLVHGAEVLTVGEGLVISSLPVFFTLVLRRSDVSDSGKALVISVIPAAIFTTLYVVSPWATSAVAIMGFGLSLYLPFPIYAGSLWCLSFLVVKTRALKRSVSFALMLLLLAGLMLHHPYLNLLVLLALVILNYS
jgi:hypothetical protein